MSAPDGTISIDINNNLVHTINQHIQALPGNAMEAEKSTIFRVPKHIRQKKEELYKPRIVSIGPYYNGEDALQAMEMHKWRYLRDLLSRNTIISLEHYINELRGLESQARRCYFEKVKPDEGDQFLMMMLLDGCFIIEFLIKYYSGLSDAIFDLGWILPVIRNDLLLIENQIPFFVIQKLFGLLNCSNHVPSKFTSDPNKIEPLVKMLLEYLSEGKQTTCLGLELVEIKHILHLYHLCYVSSLRSDHLSVGTYGILGWLNPIKIIFFFIMFFRNLRFGRTISRYDERFRPTIPCATELKQAGVIIKSSRTNNILDIKFQHGTLEIPFFRIDETWESRLLNLVSFEQLNENLDKNLMSYANFMGCLFKTARDVTLLQEKKVIDNLLATNEELVSFFDLINEYSWFNNEIHYLKELADNVNKYYLDDWHQWKVILRRDYFSNRWSFISFTASFVLMVLTVLQTVYTILSYH